MRLRITCSNSGFLIKDFKLEPFHLLPPPEESGTFPVGGLEVVPPREGIKLRTGSFSEIQGDGPPVNEWWFSMCETKF